MQKLAVFKVREGKLETWRAWSRELETTLRNEAKQTLAEEGLHCEFTALIEIESVQYVIGYMDGEGRAANMDLEINQKHKAMKEECLEYVSGGEFLYHLRQG